MSMCAECSLPVVRSGRNSSILCSECGSIYHGKCIQSGSDRPLSEAELEILAKGAWKCGGCMVGIRLQRGAGPNSTPIKTPGAGFVTHSSGSVDPNSLSLNDFKTDAATT
ncbi:uncharacterized protein LOC120354325 [Nilaparvata lugens]|uniref:uncharacterized protein LOC120354325 n=1 Tax=Nilaparvata lugens TaxID=108931 RepID=UPI00193CD78F|nr:uncharacterized protein LOC120354325 [Nilaparvata lugens]